MKLSGEAILSLLSRELGARPEITFAYIFGSILDSDAFRDVDIALYMRQTEAAVTDSLEYSIRLSGMLERMTGHQVDVIMLNTAPDHLIHRISKGRLTVNRDDDLRTDFITRAWSRYFDIQVKRRAYLKAVAEGTGAP